MGFRKIIFILLLCPVLGSAQNIKYKMLHRLSPASGKFMLHILPWEYDSTLTDEQLARCADTLPGHLFSAKMYNMVYKNDTGRLAAQIDEGVYFSHKRYTIFLFWKNGNKKSISYVNRHFFKYHEWSYYENDAPKAFGRYLKGNKKGRWVYFNTQGLKVRVEKYSRHGVLKKTKSFDPPKKTLRTTFHPRHLGGTPYVIK